MEGLAGPCPELKPDGKLYLKDDRDGKFIFRGTRVVESRCPQTFKTLSEALRVKADKEWISPKSEICSSRPDCADPGVPIRTAIQCRTLTRLRAARLPRKPIDDLRESEAWNEGLNIRRRKTMS